MKDYFNFQEKRSIERFLKRRKSAIVIFTAGTAFVIGTGLSVGFRAYDPNISPVQKTYIELMNPNDGNTRIDPTDFFNSNGIYEYSHRGGNSIEDINTAFKEGTNVFDIDANDFSGTVYGEHGFILHGNVLGKERNAVIDPMEVELAGKLPATFEELIKHISSLSTVNRQLGVKIELKYGDFDEETVKKMIDTLFENNVPAIIQPLTKERQEFIRSYVCKKIARKYLDDFIQSNSNVYRSLNKDICSTLL